VPKNRNLFHPRPQAGEDEKERQAPYEKTGNPCFRWKIQKS